jgi:hypothetical protein
MLKTFRSGQVEAGQSAFSLQSIPALTPPRHLRRKAGPSRVSISPNGVSWTAQTEKSDTKNPAITKRNNPIISVGLNILSFNDMVFASLSTPRKKLSQDRMGSFFSGVKKIYHFKFGSPF